MSACEICWGRAQQDALLLGGSVVDHYKRRLDEIDADPGSPHSQMLNSDEAHADWDQDLTWDDM